MSSDAEAQKAISTLNGTSFMDRNIIVSEAKPQERREREREIAVVLEAEDRGEEDSLNSKISRHRSGSLQNHRAQGQAQFLETTSHLD